MTSTIAPYPARFLIQSARLAARSAELTGWQAVLLLVMAGAASVLAMAPFHVWPILCLTLPILVWRVDGAISTASGMRAVLWRAAAAGWLFGFGYFLAGLFWIGEAFLVEAERFAVLMPFAVMLMPAGLGLFWAAACAAAAALWRPGITRVLVLALMLGFAEWLRGHIFTGFPWNVLGYALTYPITLMQSAAAIGIYGLTLVAILALAAPLVAVAQAGQLSNPDERRRLIAEGIATCLVPIILLAAYGTWRLSALPTSVTDLRVRLVQPSVPQRQKWRPENQRAIFEQHLALSHHAPDGTKDGAQGIGLIIWPEAAMPFAPLATPDALAAIGRMLPDGTHLVSGALRAEDTPGGSRNVFNSLIAFGPAGAATAIYDKIHLVPFGEYLPLQATLESIGLEQLSRLRGGFAAGPRPRPLMKLSGVAAFGPLICYEAIFPGALIQGAERPAFLVNVTNDGWFGNTTGPRQHLHQARVRSVEEGIPILRVANNGISAVVDTRGVIIASLGLDVVGVIDANVPGTVDPPPYARFGDAFFFALLGLGVVLVRIFSRKSSHGQ